MFKSIRVVSIAVCGLFEARTTKTTIFVWASRGSRKSGKGNELRSKWLQGWRSQMLFFVVLERAFRASQPSAPRAGDTYSRPKKEPRRSPERGVLVGVAARSSPIVFGRQAVGHVGCKGPEPILIGLSVERIESMIVE